jgi:hypothetical protein
MLRRVLIRWAVSLGLLVFHASVALGRAGGGGGYSSGGSSSSSSSSSYSSGGSGSGSGGDFTVFDAILIAVVILVLVLGKRRVARVSRQQVQAREGVSRHWADAIRERDPKFDLENFEERVERAFAQIQQAWSKQNLSDVRGFMSDGVHERFSIQLREQRALGYRNEMSAVRVLETSLVDARFGRDFDVVSVRITASASDARFDCASGREIQGSRRAERFTEIWSFLRGREVASDVRQGLFEGRCPNCAAPVDPMRVWACASCGSELKGPPPDWVLTEITQQSEWSSREATEEEWLKAALRRDPGLTAEQIEDRASVLFWRLMDSDRTGNVEELSSVARPSFVREQAQWFAGMGTHYVGDCAVGSVELRGIIAGQDWDLALEEIRWSGGVFERDGRGGARETGDRKLRRNLLVMARRAGAQSDVSRCIVSAHCPDCGAPDEGSLDGCCSFCARPLNDGRDWLIKRFLRMDESEAVTLLAEAACSGRSPAQKDANENAAVSPTPIASRPIAPGATQLFGWCLTMVYADQSVDRRERNGLARLAKRLGLSKDLVRKLTRAAQFGRLEVEGPGSAIEAATWLEGMREIAEVDGRLDRRERALLSELAGRAGLEAEPAVVSRAT